VSAYLQERFCRLDPLNEYKPEALACSNHDRNLREAGDQPVDACRKSQPPPKASHFLHGSAEAIGTGENEFAAVCSERVDVGCAQSKGPTTWGKVGAEECPCGSAKVQALPRQVA